MLRIFVMRIADIAGNSGEKKRKQSAAATELLKYAFNRLMPEAPEFPEIARNRYGKPYFPGYLDFHFNLSHSGEYAVCAVSDAEVGVDIENVRKVNLNIADRFFTEAEKDFIAAAPTEYGKFEAFFGIWVIRESYVKAVGTGIVSPMNGYSVRPGEKPAVLQGGTEAPYDVYLTEIRGTDYRMAVCRYRTGKRSVPVIEYLAPSV